MANGFLREEPPLARAIRAGEARRRRDGLGGKPRGARPDGAESALASNSVRLYRRSEHGSFDLVYSRALNLDPADPLGLLLTEESIWQATAPGEYAALDTLRPELRSRGLDLWLASFCEGDRVAGGVLTQADPRTGQPPAALLEHLLEDDGSGPHWVSLLARLGLEQEAGELRAFREAVGRALPYGFLGLDQLGRVLYFGGRAEEILGVSAKTAVLSDVTRIFRTVGTERHPLLEALKGRATPVELYLLRPDGTEVPISLEVSRGPVSEDGSRGLVAFFRDLSDERALADAERQRDRLAALGELSAGVAHEIRNPLTGIANCAHVLQEGRIAEDQRSRFLDIIRDEAARLNRIVDGLLRYARPHRPELREADLLEVVRRVMELEQGALEAQGIRAELRVRGRIPRIYIDLGQIEQVLLNLVRNARDAMAEGGELSIEVAVIRRVRHRRRGTGRRATDRVRFSDDVPRMRYVQVRIRDTGAGIPKDQLSRIWNPFYTTRPRGTGLGLSLSLSIVQEHGGALAARSVEKKGTTILLDLPVERRQGERRHQSR